MNNSKESYHPLFSKSDLENVQSRLASQSHVAVDTEFLRERTYFAQLCLLQMRVGQSDLCVDVIQAQEQGNLDEFIQIFNDQSLVKIFHAARQDIEVVLTSLGVVTSPIFDTQLAAAFCGADMQIGYAALVEQELGVELPKSQARTDWSRRPLSDKQIEYALNDVRYLFDLHDLLSERLEQQNKRAWFDEEIHRYADRSLYEVDPKEAYQRLSGGNLSLEQQYVLKALAEWREHYAIKKNLPRSWILKDRTCYDIADKAARGSHEQQERNIDMVISADKGAKPRRSEIFQAVTSGLEQAAQSDRNVIWERVEPLNKHQKSICSKMMKVVAKCAKDHQIAQGLLCTRKDVEALYRFNESEKLLSGWRKGIIGDHLLQEMNALK